MILQNPTGITPSFELTIGGVPINYTSIDRIEVNMNEGEHDMVVFRMLGIPAKGITDYLGAPVQLFFRRGTAEVQEFVGEVAQIIPESELRKGAVNRSPFQIAEIYCMGASYRMRAPKSRNWGPKTLVDIATRLAHEYQFSLDVPNTDVLHTDTAQINKSDWEFINDMVNIYGYCLSVHGTHMHIWDPWRSTGRQISYHVIQSLKAAGYDPNPKPGVIVNFSGDFSTHSATDRYTSVLDAHGNVVTINSAEMGDTSGLGKPYKTDILKRITVGAKSIQEAEVAVKASVRASIPFRATADVVALIDAYPGGLVRISGYDSMFDGIWYIASIKQVLGGVGMTTTLELVLDSTNDESSTIYNTQRFNKPPSSQYLNGKWITTNEVINVYA